MKAWILINLVLSCSVLVAIALLRDAPARLRLCLCLAALVAWCLPLSPLQLDAPPPMLEQIDWVPIAVTQPIPTIQVLDAENAVQWSLHHLLLFALGFGAIWFLFDCWRGHRLLKRWRAISRPATALSQSKRADIRWLPATHEAVTTGVLRPTIWLGEKLRDKPELPFVLEHELVHAKRYDNFWLGLITLVQRLYWWNLVVWLLARSARQQLELACDETCAAIAGRAEYRAVLAELLHHRYRQLPLNASTFFSQPTLSILRIRRLGRQIAMKKQYWLVLALLAMVAGVTFVQADSKTIIWDNEGQMKLSFAPDSVTSRSSISHEDDGVVRWSFDNVQLADAVQALADPGGLEVLVHPSLARQRVSANGTGTNTDWIDSVRALLDHSGDENDYLIDQARLLVGPIDSLRPDNRDWLDTAIRAKQDAPEPPNTAIEPPAFPVRPESGIEPPAPPEPPVEPQATAQIYEIPLQEVAKIIGQAAHLEPVVFPGFEDLSISWTGTEQSWRHKLSDVLPEHVGFEVHEDRLIVGPYLFLGTGQIDWIDPEPTKNRNSDGQRLLTPQVSELPAC